MSRISCSLGVFLFATILGCGGSPTAAVSGSVTLNGKPIPSDAEAFISFAPSDGGEPVSVPIKGGKYESLETPLGNVSVRFYISQKVGKEIKSERTGETYQEEKNLVPTKYATGIDLEVTDDNANQNFDL